MYSVLRAVRAARACCCLMLPHADSWSLGTRLQWLVQGSSRSIMCFFHLLPEEECFFLHQENLCPWYVICCQKLPKLLMECSWRICLESLAQWPSLLLWKMCWSWTFSWPVIGSHRDGALDPVYCSLDMWDVFCLGIQYSQVASSISGCKTLWLGTGV